MTFPPPPQGPAGGPGPQQPGFNNGPGGYPPPYPNQPQQPMYSYDQPGVALVQGTGKARAMKTLAKSFSLFGQSVGSWILFCIIAFFACLTVVGIISMVGGIAALVVADDLENQTGLPLPVVIFSTMVTAVINGIVVVYFYNGALKAVSGRPVTLGDFFKLPNGFFKPFITAAVVSFVMGLPGLMYQVITAINPRTDFFAVLAASAEHPEMIAETFEPTALAIGGFLGLVVFLANPLLSYAAFYSLDRGMGLGEALSSGFADGLRNYLPIMGYTIVMMILALISAIPLGLGLLVTIPATTIGMALIYRQMSGGVHVSLD